MKKSLLVSLLCVLAGSATAASADTAITGFSAGAAATGVDNQGSTVGYAFTAQQNLSVTSLGIYDTGLTQNHDVGIFNSAGTLLGSATVLAAAADVAGYKYQAVTPFNLLSGTTYYIGAYFTGLTDSYQFDTGTPTTSSAISFGGATYSKGSALSFDNLTTSVVNGRFGPNFMFTTSAAAVPEAASWAIMLAGAGMVGVALRRRQRVSTRVAFG